MQLAARRRRNWLNDRSIPPRVASLYCIVEVLGWPSRMDLHSPCTLTEYSTRTCSDGLTGRLADWKSLQVTYCFTLEMPRWIDRHCGVGPSDRPACSVGSHALPQHSQHPSHLPMRACCTYHLQPSLVISGRLNTFEARYREPRRASAEDTLGLVRYPLRI